jgi:hypothetical protein
MSQPAPASQGGLGGARLIRAHLARNRLRTAALVVCVAGTVALAAALPLSSTTWLDAGLRQALVNGGYVSLERPGITDFDTFAALQRDAEREMTDRLGSYLDTGMPYASVPPVGLATLNDQPAPANARVAAGYAGDLAGHVQLLAGEIPPDGLGGAGGLVAVTMPQDGADQAGLHLSDRLCLAVQQPGGQGPWCARIVGLWRPLQRTDPFWGGSPPAAELLLGRYDFFTLVKLQPNVVGGRRFTAGPAAADVANLGDVSARTRDLRGAFASRSDVRLSMSLDQVLDDFAARERRAAVTAGVVTAALVLLGVCLTSLAVARVLDVQARDLGLMRLRGWELGRVWRLVCLQLAALVLLGLVLGLVSAVPAFGALGAGSGGPAPSAMAFVAAGAAVLAALAGVMAAGGILVAAAIDRAAVEASQVADRPLPPWWRRWHIDVPLGLLAVPLLVLAGLQGAAGADLGMLGQSFRVVAPIAAVSLIALAALRTLPVAARRTGAEDVPGALAAWQLDRRPDQHAGVAFLLVLAVAVAAFSTIGLAAELQMRGPGDALRTGLEVALGTGFAASLTVALAGFALHFQASARRRAVEYAVLAANGLPEQAVDRSLAAEQTAVRTACCVAGLGLGLALAFAVVPPDDLGGGALGAAAGAFATAVVLPVALLLVGLLVRRRVGGWDLVAELGRP